MAASKQDSLHPVTAVLTSWAIALIREWGDDSAHFSVEEVPQYHYSLFIFWYNGEVAYEQMERWWDVAYLLKAGEAQELESIFKRNILSGLERFFLAKTEYWQSNAEKVRACKEGYDVQYAKQEE